MSIKHFSLISYLGGEEFKKIRNIQKQLTRITGSKKCLEDWLPHITIGDGISVAESDISKMESKIQTLLSKQESVQAKIIGFGGINNWKGAIEGVITPYVLWLNIQVDPDLLKLFNLIQDSFTSKYKTWLPRTVNYTPHITLAFADLTKEGYELGSKYLSQEKFDLNFTISHLALTECYGVGNMESVEYKKYYFL